MAIKLIQTKKTTLSYGINDTATTMRLTNLLKLNGSPMSASDIGDVLNGTYDPGTSREEIFSIDGANVTVNADGTVDITNVVRGLLEVDPYTTGGFKTDHPAGAVVVFGNNPQVYNQFGKKDDDNVWTGDNDFTGGTIEVPTPTTGDEAANKSYVDGLVVSGAPDASVDVKGVSRLSASPNGTPTALTSISNASPAVCTLTSHGLTLNDSIIFTTTGTLPTGLSLATTYYVISAGLTANNFEVSATLGGTAINTSSAGSGTHSFTKTTPVAVGEKDTRLSPTSLASLTAGKVQAFAGTSGTPDSTNPYVTQNDTTNGANQTATTIAFVNSNPDTITDSGSGFVTAGFQAGQTITVSGSVSNNNTFTIASVVAGTITLVAGDALVAESAGATVTIAAATIGKLIRTTSTGVIPSEILTESNVSTDTVTETASGDIAQYDYVYANGANTAKTVQPTSILSQTSPSTTPSFQGGTKAFRYDSTRQIYFSGGAATNQSLDITIGTANSASTNVTFGSPTNIAAEAYYFDVCELSTGNYVLIWQNSTAGVASGIKVIAVTYNGATVTIGSITTLETLGTGGHRPSCATLDSGRSLLTYRKDSNGFLIGQIIDVSGTSISTNSTSNIIASSGGWVIYDVNLDTDKTFLSYNTGTGSNTTSAVVVETSGTTISTIGTPVTVATFGGGNMFGAPAYRIATNKVFVTYRNSSGSTNKQQTNIITNSGNTLTVNAQTPAPNDGGVNGTNNFGQYVSLNDTIQLGLFVNGYANGGSVVMILDMSGTTLSLVSVSTSVGNTAVMSLVKLAPFIYGTYGGNSSKQIINLTNPPETRLGVAMTAIADTVSGGISLPYRTVSGFVGLTPATLYYTDDDGSYTTESSIYTREYGVAINSTTMLIK